MDVVVDFLLEYYVWVLVVLVILIITVIGFLVDTKKKKKLREKSDNNLNQQGQTMGTNNMNGMVQNPNMMDPMMNQNMNNNLDGFNDAMFNPNPPSFDMNMNQGINTFEPMMNQAMNNNLGNNMMNQNNIPVQNQTLPNNFVNTNNQMEPNVLSQNNMINQNITPNNNINNSDAFFVPTSQQSPVFESKEVVIPKPVETAPLMGSTPTPVIEPIPVQPANPNTIPNQNMNMVNGNIGTIPNMMDNSVNQINQMPRKFNTITPTNVVVPEMVTPQMEVPNMNMVTNPVNPVVQNIIPEPVVTMQEMVMPSQNQNMQINNTIPVMPNVANNPLPNNDFNVFQAQNIMQNPVVPEKQVTNTMLNQNQTPVMNMPNNMPVNPTVMGPTINNTAPTGNDNWSL